MITGTAPFLIVKQEDNNVPIYNQWDNKLADLSFLAICLDCPKQESAS